MLGLTVNFRVLNDKGYHDYFRGIIMDKILTANVVKGVTVQLDAYLIQTVNKAGDIIGDLHIVLPEKIDSIK